jgi:hypothetical protein
VETPSSFVDTIWAQNNEWSHSTEEEIGLLDIFDRLDDSGKALVYFTPVLSFGVKEQGGGEEETGGQGDRKREVVEVFPYPGRGVYSLQITILDLEL